MKWGGKGSTQPRGSSIAQDKAILFITLVPLQRGFGVTLRYRGNAQSSTRLSTPRSMAFG